MSTPYARLIVEDILTTLAGITVANGYKTTVATVTPYSQTYDEATDRPAIGVHREQVLYSYVYAGQVRCTMTVSLLAHVSGDSNTAIGEALEDLLDDLIGALNEDPTRGGVAVDTKLVSSSDDTGEPMLVRSNGQTYGGSVALQIQCMWDRNLTSVRPD